MPVWATYFWWSPLLLTTGCNTVYPDPLRTRASGDTAWPENVPCKQRVSVSRYLKIKKQFHFSREPVLSIEAAITDLFS